MSEISTIELIEQAARLLRALKIDSSDKHFNRIAKTVIEKFGGFERAVEEIAKPKYDRLRYTPEIMLSSMVETEDTIRDEAEALANKLHSLRTLVIQESSASGVAFEDMLAKIDVIRSLSLSHREAWATKFVGGKDFIRRLNTYANGDAIAKILVEALQRADEYIQNAKDEKAVIGPAAEQIGSLVNRAIGEDRVL